MWNCPLHLDKYQYARTSPYRVKIIGVLGIITTLLMGYGLLQYIQLRTLYLFLFGPIIFIFIVNKLIRFFIQLFYQEFDITKHVQFIQSFWSQHEEPSIDIFLPWAGEDLDIHEKVVQACSQLNYKNYKVYMLDDVGSSDHQKLAEKYGFVYLSRPNKGVHKKSGNLEYGYNHSNGQFVLILDADFIPISDILKDLIPYIASDKEIGILQTPQYFEQTKDVHSRSRIEFGGGNIVEDFYRIILPCRDEFKAAMCVGTSAIYRRDAIMKLNGTPKVHASEDLATGLLITRYGYYVKYLPLIVSMGKSPETFQGYFKQHMRWCSGNLVFARYWPTARLSLMARLIYIINPMYYLTEALTVIFSFQFLILLYFHTDSLSIYNTIYFLPYVILSRLIIPFTKSNKNKLGTKLAALNNSYTYFYTYIRMLTKGVPAWHPTGAKFNGLHDDFVNAFNIGTFISTAFILSFLFVIVSRPQLFGNYNTYIVLAWTFYSLFWHVLFLTFVADYVHPFKIANVTSLFGKAAVYARTHMIYMLFFVLAGASIFNTTMALHDPEAPTLHALDQLRGIQNKTTTIAVLPSISPPVQLATASTVLGTQTTIEGTPKLYSFTVDYGDSRLKLAKRAITEFLDEHQFILTEEQLNYAVYVLDNESEFSGAVTPGKTLSYNMESVLNSVEAAILRFENEQI